MLNTLVHQIESETAAVRFMRAARALERRYRPDQPRVPAGNPDGGEWTNVGGRTRDSQVASDGWGRVTFSGPLLRKDYDRDNNRTLCLYRDLATGHTFAVWEPGTYCPTGRINY